ncbi:hypothetical protein HUS71_27030, partial [Pandoraea nosoerga]|nr:hypothetical protein [Pandoraea nosoerga]
LDGGLLNLGGDTAGNGPLGGLLGGLIGSGSGHLAGVTIGPHLLDLGALTGTHELNIPSLNIPSLGGVGADGLAGNLLGSLNLSLLGDSSAAGHAASAPASTPVDLGT